MQKKLSFRIAVIIAAGISLISSCTNSGKEHASKSSTLQDTIKRGEYLVGIMGCHDCHSPKQMGPHGPELIPGLMLSGYPSAKTIAPLDSNATKNGWVSLWADLTTAVGPWGQTYAANITSDNTGIGSWTLAQFKKALTEGKYKGLDNTRPIMPPMPWQNYRNLQEDDLAAIFAYLKSTKPVRNVPPDAKLNPPPPAAK